MFTATPSHTTVINLDQLADLLNELSRQARDLDDRGTDLTDRDIQSRLGFLGGIADSFVFSRCSEFDDQKALDRVTAAAEEASKAWSFLRSGAADVQRILKEPSDDDLAFIIERMRVQFRMSSPNCRTQIAPDLGDVDAREILKHLRIPGSRPLTLDTVLFKCANLSQARRVLKAIGLPFSEPDSDSLRVGHELIYVRR